MFFNVSLQFNAKWKAAPPNLSPEALPGTISFQSQEMVLGQACTLTFSNCSKVCSRDALFHDGAEGHQAEDQRFWRPRSFSHK